MQSRARQTTRRKEKLEEKAAEKGYDVDFDKAHPERDEKLQ
jgi:hypothetical protein